MGCWSRRTVRRPMWTWEDPWVGAAGDRGSASSGSPVTSLQGRGATRGTLIGVQLRSVCNFGRGQHDAGGENLTERDDQRFPPFPCHPTRPLRYGVGKTQHGSWRNDNDPVTNRVETRRAEAKRVREAAERWMPSWTIFDSNDFAETLTPCGSGSRRPPTCTSPTERHNLDKLTIMHVDTVRVRLRQSHWTEQETNSPRTLASALDTSCTICATEAIEQRDYVDNMGMTRPNLGNEAYTDNNTEVAQQTRYDVLRNALRHRGGAELRCMDDTISGW